ncbi:hypothetical protein VULLAG_LOCUS10954 [Vulpes lagopus]
MPLPARDPAVWPPSPGWAAAIRPPPPPAQEVSVRGQFPPLASATASLGAAGVPVAKGEATIETKVSEKERRFPAPAGAVSSSPPLLGLGVSSGRASGNRTDPPP